MELDEELSRQEVALGRDNEIKRILACGESDHFAVLDLFPEDLALVKKTYRKKSILIHPDKTDNVDAPAAFDRLKQAEQFLSDEETDQKERLVSIYEDVLTWPEFSGSVDKAGVRKKVSLILADISKDEEVEKLYKQRSDANRQAEASKVQSERQLKRKMESKWEDAREQRVSSWRAYSGKVEKKKKTKKKKVLA